MFIFAEDILSAVTQEECAKIAELAKDKVVLELGSHFGRSTVALASTARVIHAVDWHLGDIHAGQGDTAPILIANLTRYRVRDKVAIHVAKFEDILPLLENAIFDFCFIDALHTKEAVAMDARSVVRLMKPKGVISFHDYGRPEFGVTEAVNEFAKSVGSGVGVTGTVAVVDLP